MKGHNNVAAGFSFAELLMGVLIFVVAAVVLGNHITVNYSTTSAQRDRVFAYSKAQAVLSEIHSFVDRGEVQAAIDLDILDDGITNKPSLTIARDTLGVLLPPDHPLSGNIMRDNGWLWSRRISVRPFSGLNNRNVRYVTVRVFKRDQVGKEHELATLSSVVNSVGSSYPTTQVFDVYLLAIENIPGWWVYMEAIVPFLESAITDLENRNPGLSMRTHWITKAGYGRNWAYRPHLNSAVDSNVASPEVYLYPGTMPSGSASSYYYVPDLIKARIEVDGVEQHGYDSNTNPYPYALADFYNHCLRYPQAKAYHDQRVAAIQGRKAAIAAAKAGGLPPPPDYDDMSEEPPLQILLEEMASDPDRYRHALVVNLHGELLPAPSLRNYSDPAKNPESRPGVRVVVHPEELRTRRPGAAGTETTDVKLRVYAYTTDPATYAGTPYMQLPILLYVMDMDLTDGTGSGKVLPGVGIENLRGGFVPGSGTADYFPLAPSKDIFDGSRLPLEMAYGAWFVNPGFGQRKYTMIVLYFTPVRCTEVATRGLRNNERSRLYNLEYVPSCTEAAKDFSRNLYAIGDGPKNTARWVITIPGATWAQQRWVDLASPPNYFDPTATTQPDQLLTIRTRIYDPTASDPFSTGTWPSGTNPLVIQPDNFSETYTWWAATRDAVPFTERAQFQGDPRHNPYRDLLTADLDFGDGYNWFFDSLQNGGENSKADYPGIVRTWNRWNGALRQDVPRFFELMRTALVKSESIYTTLSGYSYYYMGHGNEIGYDSANGYASSIPVNLQPWGGGNSTGNVNNITGAISPGYRRYVRNGGGGYWWGMPWLGELYPDWAYATGWFALDGNGDIRGNLPSGSSSSSFYRGPDESTYNSSNFQAYGTAMLRGQQRTNTRGCVSMFNIGSTALGHFNHHFNSGNGNLIGPGIELATNYGFPIPTSANINRPFSVDTTGNDPDEYNYAPYTANRYSGSILRTYYDHPSGYTGSGMVELVDPAGIDAAYIVVNGLAQTTQTGSSFLAKFCLLSMFQSYFELGDKTLTHRIKQPPRVEIASPTEITELIDPVTVPIQFDIAWVRWDQLPYTTSTPVGFFEDDSEIEYVVMYSTDVGQTWRYVQDDTLATIGVKPTTSLYLVPDSGAGPETLSWGTPSGQFPEGSYLLRIEAYRKNQALHYSQHQVKIYIER